MLLYILIEELNKFSYNLETVHICEKLKVSMFITPLSLITITRWAKGQKNTSLMSFVGVVQTMVTQYLEFLDT